MSHQFSERIIIYIHFPFNVKFLWQQFCTMYTSWSWNSPNLLAWWQHHCSFKSSSCSKFSLPITALLGVHHVPNCGLIPSLYKALDSKGFNYKANISCMKVSKGACQAQHQCDCWILYVTKFRCYLPVFVRFLKK